MKYSYDNCEETFLDMYKIPDGSVIEAFDCRIEFGFSEWPEIIFWANGEKYSREEAELMCHRAAKILSYILFLPICWKENDFYETEQIIETNNCLSNELILKVQIVEEGLKTLGENSSCFEKVLDQLAKALNNLFKNHEEEAFFFFYKIVELIAKNYYKLNEKEFEVNDNKCVVEIKKNIEHYLSNKLDIPLAGGALKAEAEKIYVKLKEKFRYDTYWKIAFTIARHNLNGYPNEITADEVYGFKELRNSIAHGELIDDKQIEDSLKKCKFLAVQLLSKYFFNRNYEEIYYDLNESYLPFKLKIMTWNIKEGGIYDRKNPELNNIRKILKVIDTEDPDVLVIQEFQYKYKEELIDNGLKELGYNFIQYNKILKEYVLRYGVLIASKYRFIPEEPPQEITAYSRRNWNEIYIPQFELKILGVHVPLAKIYNSKGELTDKSVEKELFLKALNNKFSEFKYDREPAIILGDFNLHEKAMFKEYLELFSSELTEITTNNVTCGNYKFDYIYGNQNVVNRQKNIFDPIKNGCSDHSYLLAEIFYND